ncbi:hypothetical protein P7K49_026150, partial [Saguinus oedipus]
ASLTPGALCSGRGPAARAGPFRGPRAKEPPPEGRGVRNRWPRLRAPGLAARIGLRGWRRLRGRPGPASSGRCSSEGAGAGRLLGAAPRRGETWPEDSPEGTRERKGLAASARGLR